MPRSRPISASWTFDGLLAREPEAAAALLADLAVATDAALRAAARRLAGRVFLQLGRIGPARARGTRRLGPSRTLEGDLDLDRTLEGWEPGRSGRPGAEDVITRTWTAHRRAVCLVVGISGSMQGLAVALAAVAAARVALANEHGPAKLESSVLAFAAGVRTLQAQGVRRPPEELLSERVALRGHGTTDLAAGLRAAAAQLAAAVADERVAVLPSDCLHTRATTRPARWAALTGCTCWSRWVGGGRGGRGGAVGTRRWSGTDGRPAGRHRTGVDQDPHLTGRSARSSGRVTG